MAGAMPKKTKEYRVQIRIKDIGDQPLKLFLIGIAQRPVESGNARLAGWATLNRLVAATGDKKILGQVRFTLESEGECTLANVTVSEARFSDPFIGDELEWLVQLTKKANQSDGLKRAFRARNQSRSQEQ